MILTFFDGVTETITPPLGDWHSAQEVAAARCAERDVGGVLRHTTLAHDGRPYTLRVTITRSGNLGPERG